MCQSFKFLWCFIMWNTSSFFLLLLLLFCFSLLPLFFFHLLLLCSPKPLFACLLGQFSHFSLSFYFLHGFLFSYVDCCSCHLCYCLVNFFNCGVSCKTFLSLRLVLIHLFLHLITFALLLNVKDVVNGSYLTFSYQCCTPTFVPSSFWILLFYWVLRW